MNTLNETTISLEELVASVQTSEANMTMHHLENVPTGTSDASLTVPSAHGAAVIESLSPISTDTSPDKLTGRNWKLGFKWYILNID